MFCYNIGAMTKIGIIGGGEIGSAIYKNLSSAENDVRLWDRNPDRSKVASREEALKDSAIIFFCVPSWGLREAASVAAPNISKEAIVVLLSKGMESSGQIPSEILKDLLPHNPLAVLGGPMLAEELEEGKNGIAVVGTDSASFSKIKAIFAGSPIHLEHSTDVRGVSLCGITKNIYSLGLGISDSLELGDNFKGWLASRAIGEMTKIVSLKGGQPETVFGAAGAGDLLATGYSHFSKNRQLGEEFIKSGELKSMSEGLVSLEPTVKALGDLSSYPILNALVSIFINRQDAKDTLRRLWD